MSSYVTCGKSDTVLQLPYLHGVYGEQNNTESELRYKKSS